MRVEFRGRRGSRRPRSPRRGEVISRGWAPRWSARRAAASVGSGWREGLIAAVAYGLYSLVKGVWGGSLEEGRRAAARSSTSRSPWASTSSRTSSGSSSITTWGRSFWNAFYVVSQVVAKLPTLFLVYRYARGSYAFVRNMAVISDGRRHLVRPPAGRPAPPPRLGLHGHRQHTDLLRADSSSSGRSTTPWRRCRACTGMAPVVAWR